MKLFLSVVLFLWLALFVSSLLTSCAGVSGQVNIPLPDRLGGGVIPIVIHSEK